jgi:hypothetical protein
MGLCGLDRSGSEERPVESSREDSNKILGPIKFWEVLE